MINFILNVENIFQKDKNIFPKNWFKKIPFERSIEINYGKINNALLSIELDTSFTGRDHAGPEIELSIFGHGIRIMIPKGRHWNYAKNCWFENYSVWLKQVENLFNSDPRLIHDIFEECYFIEYYEDGLTPEESISNYYFEHGVEE